MHGQVTQKTTSFSTLHSTITRTISVVEGLSKEHGARSVANQLLARALDDGHQLTPMQVQKLVFLSHAWMLGLYGEPLIKQPVVAWQFGTVVVDVYESLRRHCREEIRRHISFDESDEPEYAPNQSDLLGQVWRIYGELSGPQLSQMTHAQGTSWRVTYDRMGKHAIVTDNLIEDYFKDKAKAGQSG